MIFLAAAIGIGCSSKRKRKGAPPSKLSKFYHNTTALYNGYFNANELLEESYAVLRASHKDNYNEILSLYDYVSIQDPKSVYPNLDKAIEKVTTVAMLHEPSKWVDDCYVLMGEAQYLKQEYETAEETFSYFKEEFNPSNPFGRNYKKKKKSKEAIKKEKEKERKEEKKQVAKEKEEAKDAREEEREAKKKAKEEADFAKKKERERVKKEREAAAKAKKKEKKRRKSGGKKKRPAKKETATDEDDKEDESNPTTTKEVADPQSTDETKTELKSTSGNRDQTEDNNQEEEAAKDEPYEEVTNEKKKDEKKEDKTAYSKGMMWYAKTLVQRDKYSNASYLVKRMREDGAMPDDARREVPVILADINIREKNYSTAIEYLDEAIELADSKSLKARYAFVQGQLFTRAKDYTSAAVAFGNAKKWAKSFEMEFMAELNMEKTSMMGGDRTDATVIAKLDKMIKEDKYSEYLDQLYFTKGEIQLENNNFSEALQSFSRSIANNENNLALKQETYYKLAYLFYDKEQYVEAKSYFDSTVQVLEDSDVRYREVSNYAENLTEVAMNISTIKMQDSLLSMIAWSDERIEKEAERLIEEGKALAASNAPAKDDGQKRSTAMLNGRGIGLKTSSFFAYDPIAKQRGEAAFKDTWGDVELADDWRRSDKSGVFGNSEEIVNTDRVPEDGIEDDAISKMITTIKSQIPYGQEAQKGVNDRLQKALFDLGKAYRDKIQNYEKAVDTHEDLLKRFPDFEQKLDVYYYLYLSYLELNNATKAQYYKEKITSEYPDTEYAKAISNPNYGADQLSAEEKLNRYYEETYDMFDRGDYTSAFERADQSDQIFGKENLLRPKFALVKAMSTGSIEGKGPYVTALKDVIQRFPNTPEKARADEILRFLQGDTDAFSGIDIEEVDDIFSIEDDKLHYVAIVLYGASPEVVVNSKIQVSNYNKKYHKLKKLQLGESPLDRKKDVEVILIRRFDNKALAMEYYTEVNKSKAEFIQDEAVGYSIYPISQRNYRKMLISHTDAEYRVWFEKNYLGN